MEVINKMSDNLHFKPDWYKITKLIDPNVLEVEDTWFIKLKGISDDTPPAELRKWLKEGYIVRVIPYRRSPDARIISDVWLGNTHINRQFSNYKIENFIQAFEEWDKCRNVGDFLEIKTTLKELIRAFYMAKPLISNKKLKTSFENWLKDPHPQQKNHDLSLSKDQPVAEEEKILNEMIENFHKWKNKIKTEVTPLDTTPLVRIRKF